VDIDCFSAWAKLATVFGFTAYSNSPIEAAARAAPPASDVPQPEDDRVPPAQRVPKARDSFAV
jgi:hypothetical protein